ncbi:MAG: hypothetical protein Q4C63_08120 [Eubacteriales bacterium]|nr:hypothetical protein [Eubacteriales bacterium]
MRYAVIICAETTSAEKIAEYQGARARRIKREQLRRQRCWYFFKQKLAGAAMLLLTVLAVWLLDGDATIAVLTAPMGLYLIFSREMLLVNEFYWKMKEGYEEHKEPETNEESEVSNE